jgi:hypothetical protein
MAKMTLSRARSLIGEIVLAKLERVPNPVDATDQAARTVIIRWLVDAMDARQLKELAALLTSDFISWPAMRKVMLEDGFPDDPADVLPPRVSRTCAERGETHRVRPKRRGGVPPAALAAPAPRKVLSGRRKDGMGVETPREKCGLETN